MALFPFGQKAREQHERALEEEHNRITAEAAERQRKAEEERIRIAIEKAENQRKAEDERRIKAAEETERERIEKERREKEEGKRRMNDYKHFAKYTTVNCHVLAQAGFVCDYDNMTFSAQIHPQNMYLHLGYASDDNNPDDEFEDEDYADDDEDFDEDGFDEDDDDDEIDEDDDDTAGYSEDDKYGSSLALDLKMMYTGAMCVFIPRLKVKAYFQKTVFQKTIDKVYVRIGGNRYVTSLSNVTKYEDNDSAYPFETDYSVIPLGLEDFEILQQIASGKYDVQVQMGEGNDYGTLDQQDIRAVKKYISVCKKAGVLEQTAYSSQPNVFTAITLFNP